MGEIKEDRDRLLSVGPTDRTRGAGHKLKPRKLHLLNITFSTVRVVDDWHRLPTEVVESPSLEIIKIQLEKALSNLL